MSKLTTTNETVFSKIRDVLVENTGLPPEKITMASRFQDLGLDSLDALAMISDMEKEYSIKIPNQEILKITTVEQAVESISKRLE